MKYSPATDYEMLVRDVYEALLRQDRFENVVIQHNVQLPGRSGAVHQIDVFWEFVAAGVRYRTCIECRHYSRALKQSQVAAFAKVLEEVGPANGIMATTVGFQRGARKLAEAAGIRLVKVNRLVRKIIIDFRTQIPIIKNVRLELDADHLAEMGAGNGAGPSALPRILVSPSEYYFLDAAGNRARSLEAILQQDPESTGLVRVSVDGLHVATSVGRVRLRAVVFERTFQEVKEERVVAGGDHVARAILEDLATGGVAYLHEHGTIGGSPDKDECDEFCTRDQHGR